MDAGDFPSQQEAVRGSKMTLVLTIIGIVALIAVMELWPSPLDRRLRAKRRALARGPRAVKAPRPHYVIGERRGRR